MNKRNIGTQKEQLAVDFLEKNNVRIEERNFRSKNGEIDIIGHDGEWLVFFEVKYRSSCDYGTAAFAVDYKKQRIICRVSDYYRMLHQINDFYPCRFDVLAIDNDNIDWIKNAFYYIPRR